MRHDGKNPVNVSRIAEMSAYDRYITYLKALYSLNVGKVLHNAHLDTACEIAWDENPWVADYGGEG